MDIRVDATGPITLVTVAGELDGKTAPAAQQQIVPVCAQGGKMLLDMSGVTYMSSAGLRLMLLLYRQASAVKTELGLVGLSEELRDTMSATGFLSYFTLFATIEEGQAALGG